jgi:hypothetical protein
MADWGRWTNTRFVDDGERSMRAKVRSQLPGVLSRGRSRRQMITVLTGVGFAQLITVLSAPILTRIYVPDH